MNVQKKVISVALLVASFPAFPGQDHGYCVNAGEQSADLLQREMPPADLDALAQDCPTFVTTFNAGRRWAEFGDHKKAQEHFNRAVADAKPGVDHARATLALANTFRGVDDSIACKLQKQAHQQVEDSSILGALQGSGTRLECGDQRQDAYEGQIPFRTRGIKVIPKTHSDYPVLKNSTVLFRDFGPVQFELDSDSIVTADRVRIAQLARDLRRDMKGGPVERIIIDGHACDLGSTEYNLELSRRRAFAVQEALIETEPDLHRYLEVHASGETNPLITNANSETARSKNRRVLLNTVLQ